MSDKAVRKLAIDWLSSPTTEIYGKQLLFALAEKPTLWELFEKEEQIKKMRCGTEKDFLDKIRQQMKDNDEY